MAMETETALVSQDTSDEEKVAIVAVGLAATLFAIGLAAVFDVLELTDRLLGLQVVQLIGSLLLLLGGTVIVFGLGSWLGAVETEPQPSAGLITASVFGGVWFVASGLVASQTLGIGTGGWVLAAVVGGAIGFGITAVPREDIGSTLPAGLFASLVGVAFLSGLIGPSWAWDLGWEQKATLLADIVVPSLTLFTALLVGWASAKAYGGFGARGRHMGAYLLVYLNAGSIVALLFLLVAFTAIKGSAGLFTGLVVGSGAGPTTTIGLFGIGFSFEWPFYWPFAMNGVSLMNDFNGVFPAIVGTVWLVIGAVLFAVPLGVGAAVFLTEYAERGRFTQVVEVATNGLWSTPSIVFGLFGFAFLVPRFGGKKSLISGMLTLGFMLLPLVLITTREALLTVPDEYRDASAALGVKNWQTIRSVVLPAALPGVVTGVILGVGRIAGETAPILLTMAGSPSPPAGQAADVIGGFQFTGSPPFVSNPELLQATAALPYQLFALIQAGVGKSSGIQNLDQFRWATALILLIVVLSFYAIGIASRYYFRRQLES
jgi:phosphate transport system permease protein